jgi:holo-[acyl-carrier protein] synthase
MDRHRSILGIGIDLVSVGKLKGLIQKNGLNFLKMIYTDHKINYCEKRQNAYELYAAVFAAKEAVVKALGTGFIGKMRCTEVEVHLENGVFLYTKGAVRRSMEEKKIEDVLFSYSTTREFSMATQACPN